MPTQQSLDGKWREIIKDTIIVCRNSIYGSDLDNTISTLKLCLVDEIKAKKDSVPNYPKGSDGEVLKHLQLGYNTAIDDVVKMLGGGGK